MIVRQLTAAPKMCQARIRLQAGAELKAQTHEGRDYLVAPVVMIVEGVVNGELVRTTTLAASVPGWNGRSCAPEPPGPCWCPCFCQHTQDLVRPANRIDLQRPHGGQQTHCGGVVGC